MSVFFSIFIGIRIDLLSLRLGEIIRCVDNNRKNRLEISFVYGWIQLNVLEMVRMQVRSKVDWFLAGK